jgi:hypothetical protein
VIPYPLFVAALITDHPAVGILMVWVLIVTYFYLSGVYLNAQEKIAKGEKLNFLHRAIYWLDDPFERLLKIIVATFAVILGSALGIAILGGIIGLLYFGWKQLLLLVNY